MADAKTTINREEPPGRWRWQCPDGHTSWVPTGGHIWCMGCYRNTGEGARHAILDARTDETRPCSEFVIERTIELASGNRFERYDLGEGGAERR